MDRPTPPRPDKIRQIAGKFSWIDVRIKYFMDDMTREELLLYFFLVTASNEQGCSWWSTRQITKKLKIGPAYLIRARRMLEERNLIATRTDELSQRTIYQVLDLPIETNEPLEIPILKQIDKKPGSKKKGAKAAAPADISDAQHEVGLKFLEEIGKKLNNA